MKKEILVLWVVVFVVLFLVISVFAQDLTWDDIGRGNTDFTTVLVNPDNPHLIYAGTANSVIKTEDGAQSWRVVLNIKGQGVKVNSILSDPQNKNSIYAATGNGLFASFDKGNNWKRIFQGKNYFEKECTSLAILPSAIYLGTKAGLFVSKDKGRSWHKETSQLGNGPVFASAYSLRAPDYIYVACVNGVFKTKDSGRNWEKTFVALAAENGNNKEEINYDADEEERFSGIRYICIDPNNLNNLYLATSKGVFKSHDQGQTWESVSSYGLLNNEVSFVQVSALSSIYAVTKSGVFEFKNGRWQELSLNLTAKKVNSLSLDNQGNIYTACDNGLFKANLNYLEGGLRDNMITIYHQNEPKIDEVQMAAIKYAQVEPEKIQQWRGRAAKKALLPQVSIGLDRNATDLWHWEGGSTTKADDDTLRKGQDSLEWDVTLNWDLGELIWNNDQTSIDVRSRLMVELRNDILDEVTKIYFERLRVKMELDNISIEDRRKRFEKELRLQELTASIDALTGGYFSKKNPNKNVGI